MRSLITALFLLITFAHAQESAIQPDFSTVVTVTADTQACINDALNDESGYEVDESEAADYCSRSN